MCKVSDIKKLTPKLNPNLALINGKYYFLNLRALMCKAMEHGFGIGAINIRGKHILDATLEAAFEERSPLIIEIAESEQEYCNLPPSRFANLVVPRIEEFVHRYGYMIPITLHMDHVQKDLSLIDKAIKVGFSSVEVDQSKHPLEKNIEITRGVVEKCHPLGVSVEGEIGEIGAAEALKDQNLQDNLIKYVPKVDEVIRFVLETGIDAFAGFFGNGHGKYMEIPKITWDRINEIGGELKRRDIELPLVMHGGSYLETVDYDRIEVFVHAVKCGCHKFNYATSLSDMLKSYLPKTLNEKMEAEAKRQNSSWRKMLGKFEEEIDRIDPSRLKNAKIDISYHLRMMIRHAWRSSGKSEAYPPSFYTV
ncbi:MAG: class II fructose-bisphosphate aldolase [Nitrospinae bacterium]|nr:class II fructose-bisphosphate aldolase [Nitrospinota bacterium]